MANDEKTMVLEFLGGPRDGQKIHRPCHTALPMDDERYSIVKASEQGAIVTITYEYRRSDPPGRV
jgi:hypothetical protein